MKNKTIKDVARKGTRLFGCDKADAIRKRIATVKKNKQKK